MVVSERKVPNMLVNILGVDERYYKATNYVTDPRSGWGPEAAIYGQDPTATGLVTLVDFFGVAEDCATEPSKAKCENCVEVQAGA